MTQNAIAWKASDWPIPYLGLPLGRNPKVCVSWDPMIERILRRLDGWKKAYLSLDGRITLIYSCLSHISNYFLSLFKTPATVAGNAKGFSLVRSRGVQERPFY